MVWGVHFDFYGQWLLIINALSENLTLRRRFKKKSPGVQNKMHGRAAVGK